MGKYEIKKSSNDKYFFNLLAGNGQVLVTSQMYASKQSCKSGIESTQVNSQLEERYERLVSKSEKPFFRINAANGRILRKSQMYSSDSGMENSIKSCMTNGVSTDVVDLSAEA